MTQPDSSLITHHSSLSGLRIVEFAVFAAGPVVSKHLANFGAEVIRVESHLNPDGFRAHYPPFADNQPGLDRSGCFALFNDGKLGVTLNLKMPEASTWPNGWWPAPTW